MNFNSLGSLSVSESRHQSFKSFLKRWYEFISLVGIFNTLYFNFKVFPFKTAIKFPVLLGKRVQLIGLYKNCISFRDGLVPNFGIVELGITRFPISPTKGGYTMVRLFSKSRIVFGSNVKIHSGCSIIASLGGIIEFGDNNLINQNSRIYSSCHIKFGNCFRCGWECQVLDSDFHFVYDEEKMRVLNNRKNIIFGDYCWIANRVSVTKGARLPDYSIVASNSLLNGDFGSLKTKGNCFVGSPAKLKRSGLYRIYNEKIEKKISGVFASSSDPNDIIFFDENENFIDFLG